MDLFLDLSRTRRLVRSLVFSKSSATSFSQRCVRGTSIAPLAIAACTAQPGSLSWAQLLKRQSCRKACKSAKVSPSPMETSVSCNSRMPGVSRTAQPIGIMCSCRPVVVWRPLSSVARTVCVFIASLPAKVLANVDLPTPDEPRKATVCPGRHHGARSA